MDSLQNRSLETFVERHRADFDTHEPQPDLWAALEQQLAAPLAASPALPAMRVLGHEAPAAVPLPQPAAPTSWLHHYGVAAALALLVLAAGASEAWKTRQQPAGAETVAEAVPATTLARPAEAPDAALYQSPNLLALTAAERSAGADSQLVRAVRGMETYYTSQLARRQHELRQLSGPALAGMAADWQRELVSLDSSYRQLKQLLPHHPQPDAVLTAMNRNLQIRLDILDQQLHLGTAPAPDPNSGTYVLADSRHLGQ